ncbi:MAG TPA: flagellar type III secretion system pore protein FliP [Fimbriimonadaceae bacterium]|nr:flagellar type III secretion system pore protein FliP [Fimbriimonadaceae bacterium]
MNVFSARSLARFTPVFLLVALTGFAAAQNLPIPNVNIGVGTAKNSDDVSSSLQILALLTVLSVAPAILMLTTAFTRIVIIFSFLRNALGTPSIPPNQVLVGLSLFLTFYVMGPTYTQINENALKPYVNKEIKFDQAVERAEKPLRAFMLKNTYEKDLLLFVNMRKEKPSGPDDVSMLSLIPAFIISELKTAFIIGFYIFVPFLVIDLIVASALMSMGMMMLPPVVVSLPAKILVFVLADGWHTIVSAIMQGY